MKPVIDSAVADVRRHLPPEGRIDLLEWLTRQPGGPSRAGIERQAGSLCEALRVANGPGRNIAIVTVVLGSLLMALVHLPKPAAMLRWPGITLLAGGSVCMVLGFLVNAVVPGMAWSAVASFLPPRRKYRSRQSTWWPTCLSLSSTRPPGVSCQWQRRLWRWAAF